MTTSHVNKALNDPLLSEKTVIDSLTFLNVLERVLKFQRPLKGGDAEKLMKNCEEQITKIKTEYEKNKDAKALEQSVNTMISTAIYPEWKSSLENLINKIKGTPAMSNLSEEKKLTRTTRKMNLQKGLEEENKQQTEKENQLFEKYNQSFVEVIDNLDMKYQAKQSENKAENEAQNKEKLKQLNATLTTVVDECGNLRDYKDDEKKICQYIAYWFVTTQDRLPEKREDYILFAEAVGKAVDEVKDYSLKSSKPEPLGKRADKAAKIYHKDEIIDTSEEIKAPSKLSKALNQINTATKQDKLQELFDRTVDVVNDVTRKPQSKVSPT